MTSDSRTHDRSWVEPFLRHLADTGNVRASCQVATVPRSVAYELRHKDASFALAWRHALDDATDDLEAEARRRAKDGVDEPVIYQGEMMGVWVSPDGTATKRKRRGSRFVPLTVKKYSDNILILLLKAHRPEVYKERLDVQLLRKMAEEVEGMTDEQLTALLATEQHCGNAEAGGLAEGTKSPSGHSTTDDATDNSLDSAGGAADSGS